MAWTRQTPPLPDISGQTLSTSADHFLIREGFGDRPDREAFDLNAPYQRGSVWTVEQQRNLIRSFLMGLSVPAVVYSELPYDFTPEHFAYRVIDGKQRILAVRAWAAGQLAVPADWFRDDVLATVPDDGMVTARDLTTDWLPSRWALPSIKMNLATEHVYVGEGNGTHGSENSYRTRRLKPAQLLVAEARVYLLLNTSGTGHTPADLDRAAQWLEDVSG